MGFQFVVMFTDSFMDDVTYVTDVEVCMQSMICYIPVCICCGSADCDLCMMTVLDLLAQLHGSIPQLHIGLIAALQISNLFCIDGWEFFFLISRSEINSCILFNFYCKFTHFYLVLKLRGLVFCFIYINIVTILFCGYLQ